MAFSFDEVAEEIIASLRKIYRSTYISVILYKEDNIINIKSNNYNNWQTIMFEGELHQDCLLFKIAKSFNELQPNQEDIIVWDNVVDSTNEIHRMRLKNGLHNGISVVIKQANNIAWCISACSDNSQERDFFHTRFHSKKNKIKEIIENLNVY